MRRAIEKGVDLTGLENYRRGHESEARALVEEWSVMERLHSFFYVWLP
jgi:hypothetical protein